MIEFSGLKIQNKKYKNKILSNFSKIINKSNFILGKEISQLETHLSNKVNSKFCSLVSSGTSAIEIGLKSLGVKKNDEIITTSFTWVSTIEAIINLGAKPIYVDINRNSFLIDESLIEKKISKRTKAIITVSLFGLPPNLKAISKMAKKYGLYLIDDGAQSFGSKIDGKSICNYVDLYTTSFFPTKILGCFGDGGAIFTNNKILNEKFKMISNHGKKNGKFKIVGNNFRFDTIQALVLKEKIKDINFNINQRRQVAKKYKKYLSNNIYFQNSSNLKDHVYNYFSIVSNKRKKIIKELRKKNIQSKIYYEIPIHQEKAYLNYNPKNLSLPVTENISKKILSLPIYPDLKLKEIRFICNTINKILSK